MTRAVRNPTPGIVVSSSARGSPATVFFIEVSASRISCVRQSRTRKKLSRRCLFSGAKDASESHCRPSRPKRSDRRGQAVLGQWRMHAVLEGDTLLHQVEAKAEDLSRFADRWRRNVGR